MSHDMMCSPLLETLLSAFKDRIGHTNALYSMSWTLKKIVAAFFLIGFILFWLCSRASECFRELERGGKATLPIIETMFFISIVSYCGYVLYEEELNSFATNRNVLWALSIVLILVLVRHVKTVSLFVAKLRSFFLWAHRPPEGDLGRKERVMQARVRQEMVKQKLFQESLKDPAARTTFRNACENSALVDDIVHHAYLNNPRVSSGEVAKIVTDMLEA
jgi:hypothetical protein